MAQSPWVLIPKPDAKARLRLLCLPYEGGNAALFRQWPDLLAPRIEVCAIQLPGRGNRMREAPLTNMQSMIEALAGAVQPFLDRPAAIFGHGLGALIGFEFARFLRKNSNTQLKHLFVVGRRAPQIPGDGPPRYNLPEPEFIDALKQLDSIPSEVLEHPELLKLMLPMLRADFMLAETYAYQAEPPLDAPISVYGGQQDTSPFPDELESWREQTTAAFKLQMFPGSHFFLHSALLKAIARVLVAG